MYTLFTIISFVLIPLFWDILFALVVFYFLKTNKSICDVQSYLVVVGITTIFVAVVPTIFSWGIALCYLIDWIAKLLTT